MNTRQKPGQAHNTIPDVTEEYDKCFAVYYQSVQYIESKNISDMLVGHGPVLVEKKTGKVYETGSAFSTKYYVESLEEAGHPYAKLSNKLKIVGLKPEISNVDAIKFLRTFFMVGLSIAKEHVNTLSENREIVIEFENQSKANDAIVKLSEFGFITKYMWK